MAFDVWEKIEYVRRQPEHVRMRYVILCLIVSMVFILGIWALSLKESFQSVAKEIPQTVEKGKNILQTNEQSSSLNDLMKQAAPLQVDGDKTNSGADYFQEQLRMRDSQGSVSPSAATNPPQN